MANPRGAESLVASVVAVDYLRGHLAEAYWHQLQRERANAGGEHEGELPAGQPLERAATDDTAEGTQQAGRSRRLRAMPMPYLVVAKAGAVVRMARVALAEWNRLDPAARRRVQTEAADVRRSLFEVARALGTRRTNSEDEEMSWEDARKEALDPSTVFLMARELPSIVLAEPGIHADEIRSRMGREAYMLDLALTIAEGDGFIERVDDGRWKVTELADETLVDSDEVLLMEQAITEHIQGVGIASRDELAVGVGCLDSTADEFLDALERALFAGAIEWLGPSTFGLPSAQLAKMAPPPEMEAGASSRSRQLKPLLVKLTSEVNDLRCAIADARSDAGNNTGITSATETGRPRARSRSLAAKAVAVGARRLLADDEVHSGRSDSEAGPRPSDADVMGTDDERRWRADRGSLKRDGAKSMDDPTARLLHERDMTKRGHKSNEAAARESELAADRDFVATVERLAADALRELAHARWPGGMLVKVDGREGLPKFLKGGKTREIAAWRVGNFTWRSGRGDNRDPVYLLQDGRWLLGSRQGSSPTSFRDLLDSAREYKELPFSAVRFANAPPIEIIDNLRTLATVTGRDGASDH